MPTNVFGKSSNNSEGRIDTSLFVQKPFLRTNYLGTNIEEDIDVKNQFRIKNLPDPTSIREPATKSYVDNIFKKDIDFNDVKLENTIFVQVNYQPAVNKHLTPKVYVDNARDEITLIRNNQDNDFNNQNLSKINSNILITQAFIDNHVVIKAYVD